MAGKKTEIRKDRFAWKDGDVEIVSNEESERRLKAANKANAAKGTSKKSGK